MSSQIGDTTAYADSDRLSTDASDPVARVGAQSSSRSWRAALLLGLLCLTVYNANGRAISSGDAVPARYLPFAIWQEHTLLLDSRATLAAQGRGPNAYWLLSLPHGHVISIYPVVLPVLAAPLYLPVVAYERWHGWSDASVDRAARVMEKLTASLIAAWSVVLLYQALARHAPPSSAWLLAIAYAFGTTTWMIGSQAFWQHGLAELLAVALLWLLTAPASGPRAAAAGVALALLAANRPPDAILAAALGACALVWAGRRRLTLLAAAALPAGLVLFYNLRVAGHALGAYGRVGDATFFEHDPVAGLAGLLFSPTRGLFVFSPFLLFLVFAGRHRWAVREDRRLALAIGAGAVSLLALYAFTDWRAGISFGPRFLTDLMPLLVWLLVPVVAALRPAGRRLFCFTVAIAIAIEALGAFTYTGASDVPLFAATAASQASPMQAAWQWRNAPFVAAPRQGIAAADLLVAIRGHVDELATGRGAVAEAFAGEEVAVSGWALAGDATPWQVSLAIDGRPAGSTRAFFERADVRAALRVKSPAGWRIPIATGGLAPGGHELSLFAWSAERGAQYFLETRRFTVLAAPAATAETAAPAAVTETAAASAVMAPAGTAGGTVELPASVRVATQRLREHQQPAGYWLTAFTGAPRFEQPHPEMNTFLTALLVDLLAPVAAANDLTPGLERAKRHLTEQIEAGGLVRYHGLPDGPGIGTLGCAITPDADDTALVWRIAPAPNRARLTAALTTLDQYRTPDGLYRTWLAPRERFQCIDPGHDPDPADLAIQMHVLLLLAQERPADARALCAALERVVDEDRVWVYYRLAPLVPMLRVADLSRVGCRLELPPARARSNVPGQELWVDAVDLLTHPVDASSAKARRTGAARYQDVLERIAAGDFAALRANPPLLYHNDLTASVRRYYWSEDVGYALFLRLVRASQSLATAPPSGGVSRHPAP